MSSWKSELINIYENNIDKAGVMEYRGESAYTLLPLYHSTASAHINVTVNQAGDYIGAEFVDPKDKMTIIPITMESASRAGAGIEPHPLYDNLGYLAGDLNDFLPDPGERYKAYISRLEEWVCSDYTHPKANAIYQYLKKASLAHDLVKSGILILDEKKTLDKKVKFQGSSQDKFFVRFIVQESVPEKCWEDKTLRDCYIEYSRYKESQKPKELCYMTGNYESITYHHPKKIRSEGDNAKLLSSNDDTYYTYRGLFLNRYQAFAVGCESSQKMHNALKWLIRKQGVSYDGMTIIAYENHERMMPAWNMDTESIISAYGHSESCNNGGAIPIEQFHGVIDAYAEDTECTSYLRLLAVDAATPGRLALVENNVINSERYLENIKKWHDDCSWLYFKWKNDQLISYKGMVGIREFADILYGAEKESKSKYRQLSINDESSKRLYAVVAKRLLRCIVYGQPIPSDYVNIAVRRASKPMAYNDRTNWNKTLSLACSLVKKQRKDRYKEDKWSMSLDKNEQNRSYLYGRLLAVADKIEFLTYDKDDREKRVTNARRYMERFSHRPYRTWEQLELKIQPYINKLKYPEKAVLVNLLHEINDLFLKGDYEDDSKLDGLYLLGYHHQAYDLRFKPRDNENNTENKDKEEI